MALVTITACSPAGPVAASAGPHGVTVSYAGGNALIWAGLGYGGRKPCGFPEAGGYAVAVMLLHGASFGTAATIPQKPGHFTFAGW